AMSMAFGVDPTVIRWVIICYVGTYAFTAFAAGVLADRLGPGRVLRAGLVLSLVCFACYVVPPSFAVFLFLRVLQGASGGLLYGASPALVTLSLPASRHGWGLGWASAGLGLGLGVSPLIGGALVAAFGWRGVFLFRIPIAAAFIVLAGWSSTPHATPRGTWRMIEPGEILRWPVLHAGLLAFLANFAQFSVWLLAPYYLVRERRLAPPAGGRVPLHADAGGHGPRRAARWPGDRSLGSVGADADRAHRRGGRTVPGGPLRCLNDAAPGGRRSRPRRLRDRDLPGAQSRRDHGVVSSAPARRGGRFRLPLPHHRDRGGGAERVVALRRARRAAGLPARLPLRLRWRGRRVRPRRLARSRPRTVIGVARGERRGMNRARLLGLAGRLLIAALVGKILDLIGSFSAASTHWRASTPWRVCAPPSLERRWRQRPVMVT